MKPFIRPTESYSFIVVDFSNYVKKVPKSKKLFEIWIGNYHLGQGSHPPSQPLKVAEINATTFKIACYLYELQSEIDSLERRMEEGDTYIEDIHFGKISYNPKTNSNSWTGKYYQTEQEALKSF